VPKPYFSKQPATLAERVQFYGTDAGDMSVEFISEYKAYVAWWRAQKDAGFDASVRKPKPFWIEKASIWPSLSKVGQWWSEYPTSSIAVERAFAYARLIDIPQRGSMSYETFARELLFRLNRPIVEALLKKKAADAALI
jgi:hypothetical protein